MGRRAPHRPGRSRAGRPRLRRHSRLGERAPPRARCGRVPRRPRRRRLGALAAPNPRAAPRPRRAPRRPRLRLADGALRHDHRPAQPPRPRRAGRGRGLRRRRDARRALLRLHRARLLRLRRRRVPRRAPRRPRRPSARRAPAASVKREPRRLLRSGGRTRRRCPRRDGRTRPRDGQPRRPLLGGGRIPDALPRGSVASRDGHPHAPAGDAVPARRRPPDVRRLRRRAPGAAGATRPRRVVRALRLGGRAGYRAAGGVWLARLPLPRFQPAPPQRQGARARDAPRGRAAGVGHGRLLAQGRRRPVPRDGARRQPP